MKTLKTSLLLFFFCAIFASLFPPLVRNQAQENGVVLYPVTQEFLLPQGGEGKSSFRVQNKYDYDLDVSVEFGEFSNDSYLAVDALHDESAANWLRLAPEKSNSFALKSNESYDIDYSVMVPQNAPEKLYQPVILVEFTPSQEEGNVGVGTGLSNKIVHQILLTVSNQGQISLDLKVKDLGSNSSLYFANPVKLKLEVENLSPFFGAKPLVKLQILNQKGNIVYQKVFNEQLATLPPGQSLVLEDEFKFEAFSLASVGKYHAEVVASDINTNSQAFETIDFYVFPYPIIFVGVGLAAVAYFLLYIFKAISKNRKLKLAKSSLYK